MPTVKELTDELTAATGWELTDRGFLSPPTLVSKSRWGGAMNLRVESNRYSVYTPVFEKDRADKVVASVNDYELTGHNQNVRGRTWNQRKDGTFNIEAITKWCTDTLEAHNAFQEVLARRKAHADLAESHRLSVMASVNDLLGTDMVAGREYHGGFGPTRVVYFDESNKLCLRLSDVTPDLLDRIFDVL